MTEVAQMVEAGDASTLDAAQQYADAGDAATLESANAHATAGDAATLTASKSYTDTKATATLTSANAHADAGDAATLTASKTYTDTTATQTLTASKSYTDSKFAAWNDSFSQYQQAVDVRFSQTDRRISQIGAMGSAMTNMTANAANGSGPNGRIAIGVGTQAGAQAVSIGYGKRLGDRGSFTLGASFGGGEKSAGAGFGFDL